MEVRRPTATVELKESTGVNGDSEDVRFSEPTENTQSGESSTSPKLTHLSSIVPDVNYNINEADFDDEFEEDIDDDDDFSDEFEEEPEDVEHSDVTKQLLNFAVNVSADIQKFFGSKKDEDSCDIYENKWNPKKSGRELYLADILKIANGGESTVSDDVKKSKAETHASPGTLNKNKGLGPLEELFSDVNPKDLKGVGTRATGRKPKRLQPCNGKGIQARKFPASFWIEPNQKSPSKASTAGSSAGRSSSGTAAPSTPDFSDLLDSWAGDESGSQSNRGPRAVPVQTQGSAPAMTNM